jgi:hypothetical protein
LKKIVLWEWSEEAGDSELFGMEYVMAGDTHPAVGEMAWPDPPLVAPMLNSPEQSSLGSTVMPMHGSELRTPPTLEVPGAVEHVSRLLLHQTLMRIPMVPPLHF